MYMYMYMCHVTLFSHLLRLDHSQVLSLALLLARGEILLEDRAPLVGRQVGEAALHRGRLADGAKGVGGGLRWEAKRAGTLSGRAA